MAISELELKKEKLILKKVNSLLEDTYETLMKANIELLKEEIYK